MKATISFVFILVSLIFSGCKPNSDDEPQPCIPPILAINPELFDYLPDSIYQKVSYKNDALNYYSFDLLYFNRDTEMSANPCNGGGEYLLISYTGNNALNEFTFLIDGAGDNLFRIYIGPTQSPFDCNSNFYIVTDSIGVKIDTLQLLNESFYDVYHRDENFGSGNCCSEIYYNKQYGVVGFNWLGEWYVLETDSL